MKKNEFFEMCELLGNDSGLLSFDINADRNVNYAYGGINNVRK